MSDELKQKVLELEEKLKELSEKSSLSTAHKQTKSFSPYLSFFILGFILLALVFVLYTSGSDYKVKFLLKDSPWGKNLNFNVKDCRSGDAQIPPFFGVKFYSEEGLIVKLQSDQETGEYQIWVWKDQIKDALKFKKENCSRFIVDNHLAKVKINNVNTMSGKIDVECSGLNQETLSLQAEYDQCH